jgi:hypothetical protein
MLYVVPNLTEIMNIFRLIRQPLVLFTHFFAVAFLGVFRLLAMPSEFLKRNVLPSQDFFNQIDTRSASGQIGYGLASVWWFLLATVGVVLSLPVNLFFAIRVLVSATAIIAPLIWTEFSA